MSFCSLFFRGIFFNCSECKGIKTKNIKWEHNTITQLFEGRLAPNPWLNLTRVSLFCSKVFSRITFSVIFKSIQSSNCWQKEYYLNSNFALTLGYLNPALNNSVLVFWFCHWKLTSYSLAFACQSAWTGSRPSSRSNGSLPSLNTHWMFLDLPSVKASPSKNILSKIWTGLLLWDFRDGTYFVWFLIINWAISPEMLELRISTSSGHKKNETWHFYYEPSLLSLT